MALFAYFVAYFLLTFVVRSWLVWRRTGINPLVLPRRDDAYGYVGRAFKVVIALVACVVGMHAFAPQWLHTLGPITALQMQAVGCAGWALLGLTLIWMLVAQAQMGNAWRVGIDEKNPTTLVCTGLFAVSRNPVFLAMRVNLLGLFLVLPNAATASLLLVGEVLMQVQVRLEEAHLLALHGRAYQDYCARVRRWV